MPVRQLLMVHTVFFDLDDTLFDHAHCARAALTRVRELHDVLRAVAPERFEEAHGRILEELHLDVMTGRLDIDKARIERFRRLCRVLDAPVDTGFPEMAAAAYRQHYIASRREVAGATALLVEVKRRAAVGIISNNLLEEQRAKLQHCGLDLLIDVLVVSEEAGAAKPDRTIFELALTRAGCRAEEAVMVGDSWENDVEGAREAGIAAIWVNRIGTPAPDPDIAVLRSFEPVEDAVQTIFRAGLRIGRASTPAR